MGKFLGIILGGIFVVLGIILIFLWGYEFFFIIRGVLPIMFILFGGIALAAGTSEFRDIKKTNSN